MDISNDFASFGLFQFALEGLGNGPVKSKIDYWFITPWALTLYLHQDNLRTPPKQMAVDEKSMYNQSYMIKGDNIVWGLQGNFSGLTQRGGLMELTTTHVDPPKKKSEPIIRYTSHFFMIF